MHNRHFIHRVFFLFALSIGFGLMATDATRAASDAGSSSGKREGSSSDAMRIVSRSFESGVSMKVKVSSYNRDGLEAIERLSEADVKHLSDAGHVDLLQHFDAVSPPMIGRAGHGEVQTVEGSAANKVWHSSRPMHNHAVFGPYATLKPGRYLVVYRLMAPKKSAGRMASLDVASHANGKAGRNVEASELPVGKWRVFAIPFTFDKQTARVEYRVYQYGHPLTVDRIYLFRVK